MVTKYAQTVGHSPEYVANTPSTGYKGWDDIGNLKGSSGYAICNRTVSPIATASGTYNRPAPLSLTKFDFDIPAGADIKKVVVHYSHKKFTMSSSTAYPIFQAPTITLLNTGQSAKGVPVPTTYTANTVEFTNVTRNQINSENFGVKIAYPKNTSTNTGRLALGNVYIEIVYSDPQITISASSSEKTVVLQNTVDITVDVEKWNGVEYTPNIEIEFSSGIQFDRTLSGTGGIITTNGYLWSTYMSTTAKKNTVKFRAKATAVGEQTVKFTDQQTGKNTTVKVNVVNYTDTVTSNIKTNYKQNEQNHIVVTVNTDEPGIVNRTVKIKLPSSARLTTTNKTHLEQEYNCTIQDTETEKILTLDVALNGTENIDLWVYFETVGYFRQEVSIGNKSYLVSSFTVRSTNVGLLGFSRIHLPEGVTENMGHNRKYVLASIIRDVISEWNVTSSDYPTTVRLGVYNGSSGSASIEEDFISSVVWSEQASSNWAEQKVTFKYNMYNPLYIVFSHEYERDVPYQYSTVEFTDPILVEEENYSEVEESEVMLYPPKALISTDSFAVAVMDTGQKTSTITCYDWENNGLFDIPGARIQGIQLEMDYTTTGNVELQCELSLNNRQYVGYRNITLQKGSDTVSLGSMYDLFGLKTGDFTNKLESMEIEVKTSNPYMESVQVGLNNIRVTFYFLIVEDTGLGFSINGERSEDYGIFFNDIDHVFGAEHTTSEYSVPGTDKVMVTRQNIDAKEIKMEISVYACDLVETMPLLDKIVNLFTNKREPLSNRPIKKSIIFDDMPDRQYWYILDKPFDGEIEAGMYTADITLLIPDGTSESITKTITGSNGQTNGLIHIEPTLRLLNHTDKTFTVTEEIKGLTFTCNDDNIKEGDIIIINCENNTVFLQKQGSSTQMDITNSVDFNSDYFFIQGEYSFNSETSTIMSVEYHDRLS